MATSTARVDTRTGIPTSNGAENTQPRISAAVLPAAALCSRGGSSMRTLLVLGSVLAAGAAAGYTARVQPQTQQSYPEASQRGNARIFYWGPKGSEPTGGSIGQFAIDYGQPPWNDAYDAQIDGQRDRRWRLGQNFWTNLDTNIDLEIAGTGIPAGYYYLVLEYGADDEWRMFALDPKSVYGDQLDSYHAHFTTGGRKIVMAHERKDSKTAKLTMRLERDPASRDHATLSIEFGPHRLTAPIVMKPAGS